MRNILYKRRPVNGRWLPAVIVILLTIGIPVTGMSAPPSPTPAAAANAPAEKIPSVGVDALMKAPDTYKGTVRVRGVVSAVFPKQQKLGLLDAIYLTCCSSPCGGPQALPVKWTGDMPTVKTLVLVTGDIRRTGEKLELVAKSIDKIRQPDGAVK